MTEDSNLYHKIKELLDQRNVEYTTYDHEPVFTSEEAARVRGTSLSQAAKALVMFGDKKPLMIVLPASERASFSKIKKTLSIKDLRMASADEVFEILGVEIGAVPPFGNLVNLPLYVDHKLSENEIIVFNPGVHIKSFSLKYIDYINLVPGVIGDYSN